MIAAGRKRDPPVQVHFHVQTNQLDQTFAQEVTLEAPSRKVFVERIPSISERDIVAFYPFKSTDGQSFGAEFQLDRTGQLTLGNLTLEHRGGILLARVNGRNITALNIDKTINDGLLVIPYGLTEPEVRALGEFYPLIGNAPGSKPGVLPKGASPPPKL